MALFLLVPGLLFWYGAARCQELACIGPPANAVLHALVVIPLLILWVRRPRALWLATLLGAEIGMVYASTAPHLDFSPLFTLVFVPVGLVLGAFVGVAVERRDRTRADR